MSALVWAGAGVSLLGLVGVLFSIVRVLRARRAGLDDAALRLAVQRALPLNLGALCLSLIGLMIVIAGVFMG
ncbi:MAG: hypothetical protein GDA40_03510 [Rhodobacteraceae bacterium]|nr:hypothetical protein [Paracoccaceae bacterium]